MDGYASGNSVDVTEEELEATNAKALELALQVQRESTVLLRNENATLPLTESHLKVNVFGWASTDWLGGGSGSGGVTTVEVDFLQALADYGIETNTDLTAMYEDFQAEREYKATLHSWPEQSCRMYEPSISNKAYYTEELLRDALDFSDTAIVVLGRISGESNDATQTQYKRVEKDGEISVTVKVTNTGTVGGKEIVQLYYTTPYTKGGIEKSAVELAVFEKTDYLEPGESEEITLTFDVSDMASYDCYDANNNGFTGYELEAGDYVISLRQNAHEVVENAAVSLVENTLQSTSNDINKPLEMLIYYLPTGIQYENDPITGQPVNNKFTGENAMDGFSLDGIDSEQNITYLTRADFVGTFPKENIESRPMTDELAAVNLYTEEQANAWIDENAEDIITGAKNGLKVMENNQLTDLGKKLGADYNASEWEALLDQLTVEEMLELVTHGYSHNADLDSIGKPIMLDADGPAQIGGFTGMNPGTGFSSSSTLAQSWNTELARAEGQMIGHQAAQRGYSGWYAPAVNMHRSPFNGRNYEYYSEDSLLSGEMCGNTVAGSLEAKHFLQEYFVMNGDLKEL